MKVFCISIRLNNILCYILLNYLTVIFLSTNIDDGIYIYLPLKVNSESRQNEDDVDGPFLK